MRLARRATRDATHGTRHGRHYNTPYPGRAIRELASSISRDGKQSCKVHRNSLFLHAPCTRAMDATNRRVGGVSPPPPPRAGPRWPTTARPPAHRRARDIDGTENRGPAAGARASSELCAAAGTDRHRGRARLRPACVGLGFRPLSSARLARYHTRARSTKMLLPCGTHSSVTSYTARI